MAGLQARWYTQLRYKIAVPVTVLVVAAVLIPGLIAVLDGTRQDSRH